MSAGSNRKERLRRSSSICTSKARLFTPYKLRGNVKLKSCLLSASAKKCLKAGINSRFLRNVNIDVCRRGHENFLFCEKADTPEDKSDVLLTYLKSMFLLFDFPLTPLHFSASFIKAAKDPTSERILLNHRCATPKFRAWKLMHFLWSKVVSPRRTPENIKQGASVYLLQQDSSLYTMCLPGNLRLCLSSFLQHHDTNGAQKKEGEEVGRVGRPWDTKK